MSSVPVTARQVVGREEELAAIVRLLDAPEQLWGAAALSGEAGIGKTTLWLAGIDAAADREYLILSSRPSETETHFSFAGLADLLANAAGDVFPELPPIQRRALEAALLLGESEIHLDERAVAAAFLSALRVLARDSPVCLAVDDVQWVDAPSLGALRFALARLDGEQVAALLTIRGDLPSWLRRSVPEGRLRTVDVGGLSVGAIHELLRTRLDARFPRPTLIRLWETSRGNPYFALELAAALQRRGGTLAPGDELPVPTDLDELLHARLEGLSPVALALARVVAALADPTVALVESAVGRRVDAGLAETLAARILEVDRDYLRFTHPLLGSAVAARDTPARRRSLHARLAKIAPTAEERARHLALATAEPDGDVASVLEEAARTTHARGAPGTAAELAEQALRLTPAAHSNDARRRLLIAADMHDHARDRAQAKALLDEACAAAAPGNERAAIVARLAGVQPSAQDATALYREALAEAEGDEALQASIHLHLADLLRVTEGMERAVAHAELAVRAASHADDVALRCRALAVHGQLHFCAGRGIPTVEMEEALSLERTLAEWPLEGGPTRFYGNQLWWSGDVDRARSLVLEALRAATARNNPAAETDALWSLSFLEWRAGNWEDADAYAADSLDLQTQLGLEWALPGRDWTAGQLPAVVIAAHRGRTDEACTRAHDALSRAEDENMGLAQSDYGWMLGFVELSLGNLETALALLRRAYELRNDFQLEPAMRLELGDLLEALIAAGELDEADEVVATWQERAAALDRAWALAILARSRGLLLAARGDLDGAFASFECALAEHARSTDPFHQARTLLALGRTQRRARKRGAARATLDSALAEFERLGAPLWAEQTRTELARIGGRAPSRGELTEAEHRIADLVAQGRTNREVAAALFLAEHSVETALTRVYRKLGVRSRAELARLLAAKS
jgi:DNA-binding CsgD family transcriptional regulator